MQPVSLFELAEKHNTWLAARQSAIAGNIANVDTPGYRAQEVAPFSETLTSMPVGVRTTQPAHLSGRQAGRAPVASEDGDVRWETKASGNTVVVEQELLKAQEIRKAFALNTSLIKSFHSLLLAAMRS